MKRKTSIVAALALWLAGCATGPTPAPASQLTYGLSPADVSNGFVASVLEGCVTGAERGVRLDQLGNYRILRDTVRNTARPPKPGYSAWAPGLGQGIVEIEDGPGGCDVSAYGAPVESTFDLVAASLRAKGYVAQPTQPSAPKMFAHDFKRTADGRTVRVLLIGNEPGAPGMMSRFSGLSAYVTVTSP